MLAEAIERLQGGNMRVSLFVDADPAVPAVAAEVGADRVELYTGPYGDPARRRARRSSAKLKATADACRKAGLRAARGGAGLGINAGHDLTLDNLPALMQGDSRSRRVLDRPCADRRRAEIRVCRDRPALSRRSSTVK